MAKGNLGKMKGEPLPANHARDAWKRWGPYLSERQWGTVREDYSPHGTAWEYLPHDHARSRAYRWGEDGIGGLSDDQQFLCLALAPWNERDPILKERLFGLTGNEGNHGEDVKEYYYYLDATPDHAYLKMLYKYPQAAFPYARLVEENRRRDISQPEFELIDTGVFDGDRYFDVFIEYAKAGPEDIFMRVTAVNRGPEEAPLHLLPQVWFRNTWSWHLDRKKPELRAIGKHRLAIRHPMMPEYRCLAGGAPELLFCDNETNVRRLYGVARDGYFKDGIHDYVVEGRADAVNPQRTGTKAAFHYRLRIPAGEQRTVDLRLYRGTRKQSLEEADRVFAKRRAEADAFYARRQKEIADPQARHVQRQALAGMIWSKQFYYYDIERWLEGDPTQPPPPPERKSGRNSDWLHLRNREIISMPDTWEYPWYAAWDLAFHCIPLAMVDAEFAKEQLVLLTLERYMHPNGQLPAYEWAFGDVNPPVHAWATWRVYKIDKKQRRGKGDLAFLERVFHKLLLNFTWWVNRKDADDRNIFQGGFLGLDNIGVFDRSSHLPTGGHIEQADGTSWMAMYSLNMMRIALELSETNPVYQDLAIKFFEHFLYIAKAMMNIAGEGLSLWDEEDEFYYDVLHCPSGEHVPLRVRSMVGLIPMFAVEVLEPELLKRTPAFKERLEWLLEHKPDLAALVSRWHVPGKGDRRLLSLLRGHRLKMLLKRMLDENEFLSEFGIRSLSRDHLEHPFTFRTAGGEYTVRYQPGESDTVMFGGNSNWRGPIWFPLNYLIVESLQRFHHYYGEDFKVECPTGSNQLVTLHDVADEICRRLTRIFLPREDGTRPVFGDQERFQKDPHFRDYLWFHEYFHGDNGRGVGASHQTGWTGLVAKLLQPHRPDGANRKRRSQRAPKPLTEART